VTWGISLAAVVAVDVVLERGRRRRPLGWWLEPVKEPWPRTVQSRRATTIGLSPWLGLAVAVLVWEILGIDTGPRQPHLTISAVAQAFRPMNALLLFVWLAIGIGYGIARARAPLAPRPGATPEPSADGRGAVVILGGHLPAVTPALLLPASRAAGVTFWIALVVVGVGVDLVARRSGGRLANAEELMRFITAPTILNLVLVAAWAYSGYHLFAH
jgi:hypothetical protein